NMMGTETLDDWGIKFRGYAESGYSYNWQAEHSNSNGPGFIFIDKSQDPTFDQASFVVWREAIRSPDRWDSGFLFQVIFGSDARYTQANGTNFYGSGYNNKQVPLSPANPHLLVIVPGQQAPENQVDILQANTTINMPFANGVLLTLGKFEP